MCVCACHASFHTEGFAFLPACLCIYCCVYVQACALVHETPVYFHTGTMNHFAENLSLISHLRFLFTLVGAPFQPLSLILHYSPSSARSRSHLRWATRQRIRSRRRQNSSPSPVFIDCEIDLKQGQQRFGFASAARPTLFSCRGGWAVSRSGFASVTPNSGTGIHWTAKSRLPWRGDNNDYCVRTIRLGSFVHNGNHKSDLYTGLFFCFALLF